MLVLQLLWGFLVFDVIALFGFRALHAAVRRGRVSRVRGERDEVGAIEAAAQATRIACVLYFKPVHCLQRSAALTRLLRHRGVPAQLVIGFQPVPIRSHAWVEVRGDIVSDSIKGQQFYIVVDRL